MTQDLARFVTDFGDQAVMLPIAILAAAMLAWERWWRGLAAWCTAIGGTLALMSLLKLMSIGCAPCWQLAGLASPSGHTAAAAAIYGSLGSLALSGMVGIRRWTLFGTAVIGIVFGATRLLLNLHTMSDVIVGTAVGLAGAAAFVFSAGQLPVTVRPARIIAGVLVTALLLHGIHLPAELVIRDTAQRVLPFCGCSRPVDR